MKAIKTVYKGPTNTKPSKVYASAEGGNRISISFDDTNGQADAHAKAARALADKMGWHGKWVGGALADCYVWVNADEEYSPQFKVSKKAKG